MGKVEIVRHILPAVPGTRVRHRLASRAEIIFTCSTGHRRLGRISWLPYIPTVWTYLIMHQAFPNAVRFVHIFAQPVVVYRPAKENMTVMLS